MLCVLLASAFAAQSASAATKGTTAFTCIKGATPKDFVKEHCKAGDEGTKEYGHVPIAQDEQTHITFSNANTSKNTLEPTSHTLKATVAGSAIELTSNEVHCTGFQKNRKHGAGELPEGEHWIHGTKIVCTFTNVMENKLHCAVSGITAPGGEKMVSTVPLTATTTGKGDGIELRPEEGNVFAKLQLTGCESIGNLEITVFGSMICLPSGTTINCSHTEITAQKTLRVNNAVSGPFAGYEGSVTVKGGKEPATEPTNPLSVTTVETA
jgi:hypothetical protein